MIAEVPVASVENAEGSAACGDACRFGCNITCGEGDAAAFVATYIADGAFAYALLS